MRELRTVSCPLTYTRVVPESLRVWSVDEAIQVMDEQMLRADMFPTLNEVDGTWDVCLSDERGNGIEYIAFETEEAADVFCDALGKEIERRATRQ